MAVNFRRSLLPRCRSVMAWSRTRSSTLVSSRCNDSISEGCFGFAPEITRALLLRNSRSNASCGTISIFLCLAYIADDRSSEIRAAFILPLAALVLDALDGYVARLHPSRQSHLGGDLDRDMRGLRRAISYDDSRRDGVANRERPPRVEARREGEERGYVDHGRRGLPRIRAREQGDAPRRFVVSERHTNARAAQGVGAHRLRPARGVDDDALASPAGADRRRLRRVRSAETSVPVAEAFARSAGTLAERRARARP